MTGRDLQWQDYEIPIGGLDEGTDRRLLTPGQFATVLNCEFTSSLGSVRKRPGTILASVAPVDPSDGNELGLRRFVTHEGKNQLLAVDLDGNDQKIPGLYAISDSDADEDQGVRPRHVGAATNMLVRRFPIATDLQSDIVSDVAFVRSDREWGFLVYGFVYRQTGKIAVKIVQVRVDGTHYEPSNTVYESEIPYPGARASDEGKAFFVRCAASEDRHVLVSWSHYQTPDATGNISGVVVDCNGVPSPSVSALTLIVAGTAPGITTFHDTAESTVATGGGASTWVVGYTANAAPIQARVLRIANNFGVVWDTQVGTDPRALSVFERDGNTWANWYDNQTAVEIPEQAWLYSVLDTAAGGITLAATAWCNAADLAAFPSDIDGDGWCSAIAYDAKTTEVVLFHSQHAFDDSNLNDGYPPGFVDRHITRWRRGRTNGSMGGLRQKRGIKLLSKPWKDKHEGWYLAWCVQHSIQRAGVVESNGYALITDVTNTPVLLRFSEGDAPEANEVTAQLVATCAGPLMSDPSFIGTAAPFDPFPLVAQVPQSITLGAYEHVGTDSERLGRRTVFNLRYVPTEQKSGPWDVVFRDNESDDYPAGYGRYRNLAFGGSTYMPGGLLTQWDGDRHHENGCVTAPNLNCKIDYTANLGTWPASWAQQHVFFQAVYETVLENGERVRSATSNVLDIVLSGTVDVTPPDETLRLYLEPQTVTMRSYGSTQQTFVAPRTIVTLYGSTEPNGDVLHRLFTFSADEWDNYVSHPDELDAIIIEIDNVATLVNADANEVIYTDSGELDNDLPPGGCSAVTIHKDRLWVGGMDDPEVIWYSKERVDGRPAEFSIGQQFRMPGARVTALASLDDALIVFTKRKIFAVYGEGPVATGDPASGIFTVVPISTSVGSAGPCVTAIPQGILFTSAAGLCLLNRGRMVEYVNAVTRSSSQDQSPIAASVIPALQQARIVLPFDGLSDVLVYDWDAQKWATWRYAYAGEDVHVRDVTTLGDRTFILTSAGNVYREDESTFADDGEAYRQVLTTGWISFGRLQGYKRIHQANFLMEPNAWADHTATPNLYPCGLRFNYDLNYAEAGFAQTKFFSNYELGQILPQDGISWLRMHLSTKQPSVRVQIAEQDPVLAITAPNNSATIDTTLGNNVLKLRIRAADAFSTITATSSATLTKSTLLATVTAAFVTLGWTDYVRAYLTGNRLVIETTRKDSDDGLGSHLEVDSVANGSTLNTPLGLNVAGEVGLPTVAAASQSGFVLQSMSFEVGQARGARRLPAAQSK